MKLNKAAMPAAAAALVGMIAFSAYMLTNFDDQAQKKYVSVVVSSSGDNRWKAFTQGLNQAAQENNVVLNIVSTDTFTSTEDEASVITREVDNGADGVIVEPCEDDPKGILAGVLSGTQSVLVCSDVTGEGRLDTVSTDAYGTGEMIAEQIMQMDSITSESRIGILSGNQELPAAQSKLKGLRDKLAVKPEQVIWTLSQKGIAASEHLLALSMEAKPVDILIALDNTAMEIAIDYLKDRPEKECRLYGEGRSEKCIYYLDAGLVRALAVPDEYTMGYRSLESLYGKMTYYVSETKEDEIQTIMVTQDNLHSKENAWIVFPAIY